MRIDATADPRIVVDDVQNAIRAALAGQDGLTINQTERRIDFNNGGMIAVRSTRTLARWYT